MSSRPTYVSSGSIATGSRRRPIKPFPVSPDCYRFLRCNLNRDVPAADSCAAAEKVLETPDALFVRSRYLENVRLAVGTKYSADRIYCRSIASVWPWANALLPPRPARPKSGEAAFMLKAFAVRASRLLCSRRSRPEAFVAARRVD